MTDGQSNEPDFSDDGLEAWANRIHADVPPFDIDAWFRDQHVEDPADLDAWFERQNVEDPAENARQLLIGKLADHGIAMLRAYRWDTHRFKLEKNTVSARTHWERNVREGILNAARREGQARDDGQTLVAVFQEMVKRADDAYMIVETAIRDQIIFRPKPLVYQLSSG